jgi:Tol biopolymer transport system component
VGLRHQAALYNNYPYRLEMPAAVLLAANPQIQGGRVSFVALQSSHYRIAIEEDKVVKFSARRFDELSQAATTNMRWIEEAGRESNVVEGNMGRVEIANAESPVASTDGKWISFLREERGRANLWVHRVGSDAIEDRQLTLGINVFEMSFLGKELIFAATRNGERPQLYSTEGSGPIKVIVADESRYPAVSPDGKWLAYSRMQRGSWNLWIRSMNTGQSVQITDADCNSVEPVWDTDSKTLIYASDCGRSLWFTALYKRRIFP